MPPVEPRKEALPNEKTPPSEATSQYPCREGVASIPTMGFASLMPPVEPKNWALPNENTPPSDPAIQYPPGYTTRNQLERRPSRAATSSPVAGGAPAGSPGLARGPPPPRGP